MSKHMETEIKVGIFVSLGIGLIMLAILILGGTQDLLSTRNKFTAHFKSVEGLLVGAKVIVGGVTVGTVDTIEFDDQNRNIVVQLSVSKKASNWIRKNSTIEISTQGVLGDKFLNINMGTEDFPLLPGGSEIPFRA